MDDRTKSVLMAMRRIFRATGMSAKALTRETGLSASQLVLLQLFGGGGEMTAGAIAQRMGITQATTSALLHKLEARGLLQRRKGDIDKRQVLLSLTADGQKILTSAPDGLHEQFQHAFADLEDWEQAMIVAGLERIVDMLGASDMDVAPIFDADAIDPIPQKTIVEPPA